MEKLLQLFINMVYMLTQNEEMLCAISEEKKLLIRLRQKVDTLLTSKFVTLQNFVIEYDTFEKYYDSQFLQSKEKNNCTPTIVANVLSYYNTARGGDIYSETITQKLYDQICLDINYSALKGGNLNNIASGLNKFCERIGKTCIIFKYWLDSWLDITRNIDENKLIILGHNRHAYLIIGYRIIKDKKQVYTFTGWEELPYKWLDYNHNMKFISVYIV